MKNLDSAKIDPEVLIDKIQTLLGWIRSGKLPNIAPLLPSLLRLKGKPLTLDDHFAFEPMFAVAMAPQTIIKTGRQCGKSVSLAVRGILLANALDHYSILYITPLYEQIRRFSTQYVRPLIDQSPIKQFWIGTDTDNSVLQRSFRSGGKMFFSFAYLDADRVRGVPADGIFLDEGQDMLVDNIPVIKECQSASRRKTFVISGTPKTLDNTMQRGWNDSSQAEWFIRCEACRKMNIPSMEHDLERMIGPDHKDIGPNRAGVICASPSCGRPLNPRNGRWVHRRRHLQNTFPGYHVPQIIMPIHYAVRRAWNELLAKMRGHGNTTTAQFWNESLGESYDLGTKLVNETDLRKAGCLGFRNNAATPMEAAQRASRYPLVVLTVDWGGGGEKRVSFTTVAVLGWQHDGKIDCLYGRRLMTPHDHPREAEELLTLFRTFRAHLFVHDYTGAGALRETMMIQAGLPETVIVPVSYVSAARQGIMVYRAPTEWHPKQYWQVDKTRSLVLTCTAIKMGLLRFFEYDFESENDRGLMHDFLALIENNVDSIHGSNIYSIVRNPSFPDDFAQCVNIGCCAIWQRTESWPDLSVTQRLEIRPEDLPMIDPENPWLDGPGM